MDKVENSGFRCVWRRCVRSGVGKTRRPIGTFVCIRPDEFFLVDGEEISCKHSHPKRTGTWAKRPDRNASTARSWINLPSRMGAKTKIVELRAASTRLLAKVSVFASAERRHSRVPAPLFPHPLITVHKNPAGRETL